MQHHAFNPDVATGLHAFYERCRALLWPRKCCSYEFAFCPAMAELVPAAWEMSCSGGSQWTVSPHRILGNPHMWAIIQATCGCLGGSESATGRMSPWLHRLCVCPVAQTVVDDMVWRSRLRNFMAAVTEGLEPSVWDVMAFGSMSAIEQGHRLNAVVLNVDSGYQDWMAIVKLDSTPSVVDSGRIRKLS
ncbi:hypothetical protein Vretifemale_5142 [Volvox reticuliferus]|uniref:Uncharacterized protein n=1 Tax=Volvox reticuliferus TaxID=1737510 RepID=A0A8J4C8J6_9CHLO|nr:hypothetical protein Vretifemale_5142 [Volvox reticuliferus]